MLFAALSTLITIAGVDARRQSNKGKDNQQTSTAKHAVREQQSDEPALGVDELKIIQSRLGEEKFEVRPCMNVFRIVFFACSSSARRRPSWRAWSS